MDTTFEYEILTMTNEFEFAEKVKQLGKRGYRLTHYAIVNGIPDERDWIVSPMYTATMERPIWRGTETYLK